eukprot:scaffold306029_cov27-Tisochrysis_lutea.AAC.5
MVHGAAAPGLAGALCTMGRRRHSRGIRCGLQHVQQIWSLGCQSVACSLLLFCVFRRGNFIARCMRPARTPAGGEGGARQR